jgi:hypothetical protein
MVSSSTATAPEALQLPLNSISPDCPEAMVLGYRAAVKKAILSNRSMVPGTGINRIQPRPALL